MSTDRLILELDGAEAHVLEAALSLYRASLAHGLHLGGIAGDTARTLDPVAIRVTAKLLDLLYPDLTADSPMPDLSLGDHHLYPADVS